MLTMGHSPSKDMRLQCHKGDNFGLQLRWDCTEYNYSAFLFAFTTSHEYNIIIDLICLHILFSFTFFQSSFHHLTAHTFE